VAEQIADYLLTGAVTNAINMPSISADEAPKLSPFVKLADLLGSFAGQLTETGIESVTLEYEGEVAGMNTRALTNAALCGLLKPLLADVNVVSAPVLAKQRDINVEEVKREEPRGVYETYMRLTVKTERQERSVAGTVFSDGKPRLIQVKGMNMEAELGPHMLYVTNEDKPGFIGALGSVLGNAGVNIANFNLGRTGAGADAIALIEVDQEVTEDVLKAVNELPHVRQAKALKF
jgi:D-3-phosphoglycerate dehydrogenase